LGRVCKACQIVTLARNNYGKALDIARPARDMVCGNRPRSNSKSCGLREIPKQSAPKTGFRHFHDERQAT
jgi:hypothetical protein